MCAIIFCSNGTRTKTKIDILWGNVSEALFVPVVVGLLENGCLWWNCATIQRDRQTDRQTERWGIRNYLLGVKESLMGYNGRLCFSSCSAVIVWPLME